MVSIRTLCCLGARCLCACSIFLLIGCGGVVYEYDPQTHQAREISRLPPGGDLEYSNIVVELDKEKHGKRPPGSAKTWHEYWESHISAWRRSNHPKYEEYFTRRRKEMGLKDLTGS